MHGSAVPPLPLAPQVGTSVCRRTRVSDQWNPLAGLKRPGNEGVDINSDYTGGTSDDVPTRPECVEEVVPLLRSGYQAPIVLPLMAGVSVLPVPPRPRVPGLAIPRRRGCRLSLKWTSVPSLPRYLPGGSSPTLHPSPVSTGVPVPVTRGRCRSGGLRPSRDPRLMRSERRRMGRTAVSAYLRCPRGRGISHTSPVASPETLLLVVVLFAACPWSFPFPWSDTNVLRRPRYLVSGFGSRGPSSGVAREDRHTGYVHRLGETRSRRTRYITPFRPLVETPGDARTSLPSVHLTYRPGSCVIQELIRF